MSLYHHDHVNVQDDHSRSEVNCLRVTSEAKEQHWISQRVYAYLNWNLLSRNTQDLQIKQAILMIEWMRSYSDWMHQIWSDRD